MARIKKFAENLTQNLTTFQTFITDVNPNSDYFRITEFKDTLTGGKNGFLIEGSEHLKETTEIKIQILDVEGNSVYYEPGNGIPEYYEGVSKLVSIHIYEDTPIGLAKITILGELKTYVDENGVTRDIPEDWKGIYNCKWEKSFQINKNLSNEDKVRFYRRPEVSINEIVKPIFSNIVSTITQTGNAYGIPQVPALNEKLTNFSLPTSYLVQTDGNTFWTGSMDGATITFTDLGFSTTLDDIINDTDATLATPYSVGGLVKNFEDEPYTITFNHLEGVDNLKTALTGSFAKITLSDLTTFVGDVARVKIFRKSQSDLSDYQFIQEIQLESNELLVDLESTRKNLENFGVFEETSYQEYWVTSSNNLTAEINQSFLFNSVKLDSIGTNTFFTTQSFAVNGGNEYTLTFNVRKEANTSSDDYLKVFLGGTPGPIVEDTTGAIGCSTLSSYSGGESYPTTQTVNLGENTGNTNFQFNALTAPDRFIVTWDGNEVIDTGYRGGSAYDFGGVSRSTFNASLLGETDPITGNTYPDLSTYPDDGYPRITTSLSPLPNGSGSANFNKTSSSPQLATVDVYAPLGGTAWNFTLNCPEDPPVSGVDKISNPTDIQNIVTVTSDNSILQKSQVTVNFVADSIDDVRLYFELVGQGWYISDVSLRASQETSFSPDEISFIQPIPRTLPAETFDFLFQFYDINNNYIPVVVEESKTFDGGNLNVINKRLELIPSANYFQFDSGSGNGNPVPPTTIFIDVVKEYLTGSVTFTSRSFDFFNNELSSSQYSYTPTSGYDWWKFPGQLDDIDTDRPFLTVQNFTGSRDPLLEEVVVQFIEYTGECEGVTDSIVITRVIDGKGGVNYELRPYNGIFIRNSHPSSSLEVQAIRIDGVNEINLRSNLPAGQSAPQIHVQSGSEYLTLEDADALGFINGLQPGLTGSGELNYNAIFNRDSINGQLNLYLIPSGAVEPSSSILTTITLTDLQDGLDAGVVLFDTETFTINPRIQTEFTPTFSSATASFYRRGTFENPISCSFEIYPSMSINQDWTPEYFMYFVTHSCNPDISVVVYDEAGNVIPSRRIGDYVYSSAEQTKQLLTSFTYTEPWTTASVNVDKLFTIVPEGKPGDESIVFEVVPSTINLKANSRGEVDDYTPSITDIRLKQGSRYLAFSSSAASDPFSSHGQFHIAPASIIEKNVKVGEIHFESAPGIEYTASLIVSASNELTDLSGSITYPLIIHPYYTSSIYTASVVVNYNKILDGPPPIEFIVNDFAVTLQSDEVQYITDYSNANTEIKVKEGGDFLTFTTQSEEPGTWRINSIQTNNIQVVDISSSSYDTATVNFERFDYPFLSASAQYSFTVYPYSLGPGHQYTSSVYDRTQTFVKNVASPAARSVTLTSTSETVNFDRDGLVVSPEGDIRLDTEIFNFTGSVWYQFLRNGIAYTPIQAENFFEISSGDSTAPGEVATWQVDVRDGSDTSGTPTTSHPVKASAQITISGIKAGADVYNVILTNENSSIYGDLWEYDTTGSNTQIIATKSTDQLVHKSSFSTKTQDFLGNDIGSLGEYQVTIQSIPNWITLPGGLVSGSVVPTVNDVATIGDILTWSKWAVSQSAEIVYKVDIENGRQILYKTQSVSVQYNPDGAYSSFLTNENASIVYKVSGATTTDGTGTIIRAFRGESELEHVSSFTGGQVDAFGNTGYKDKYRASVYSVSSHLDLAGSIIATSVLPTNGNNQAEIGKIDSWTNAETYPTAEVVYKIEVEGRETIYKTQNFSVQFEGNIGPGLVMRGIWDATKEYIGQVETSDYRRDAVIYPGGTGVTKYYGAVSGSGPTTVDGNGVTVGYQEPQIDGGGTPIDSEYWQFLGEEDFFVAAKMAIFEESFVKNTINIGNNADSSFANIVLSGGRTDPYIAIGQVGSTEGTAGTSGTSAAGVGVIGYDRPGIFLGMYENGAAGTTGRFSIKSSGGVGTRGLFWDGDTLTIKGAIRQVSDGTPEGSYRGSWASGTTYYIGDTVTYGTVPGVSSYICTNVHTSTNNTNITTGYPPDATNSWDLYAAAGTSGTAGSGGSSGDTGAGVVFRGEWNSTTSYLSGLTRKDVVKYSTNVSNPYWIARVNNTNQTPPASGNTSNTYWQSFGATFTSVATDILFSQDVYANRTVNVGTGTNGNPTIALNAGYPTYANPYISIGQGGTQGYDNSGIFLGFDGGVSKMSLKDSGGGYFRFNGTSIDYSGNVTNGFVTGSTLRGSAIEVGEVQTSPGTFNFRVDTLGNMYANSGSFQGQVDAVSGRIGTWDITGDAIISAQGNIELNAEEEAIYVQDNLGTVRLNVNTNTSLPTIAAASSVTSNMTTTNFNYFLNTFNSGISGTVWRRTVGALTAPAAGTHRVSYTYNPASQFASYVEASGLGNYLFATMQLILTDSATAGSGTTYGSSTTISRDVYGQDSEDFISVEANTLITLSNGIKKLAKDVVSSDILLVWNDIDKKYSSSQIKFIKSRKVDKVYRVSVDGKQLDVSDSHGFWIDGGWQIRVQDIIPGQTEIYIKDGDTKTFKVVDSVEIINGDFDVYTFRIEKFENYISNDIISHNPSTPIPDTAYFPDPHTFTLTTNSLTNGANYYAYIKITYGGRMVNVAGGAYVEVDIDLTSGPVSLQPLTAGTIINGGGMQSVVGAGAYFRVVSDSTKQYGYNIGYYTDIAGGLAIDRMYGIGGGTPAGGTNSGGRNYVGGAYSVGGAPFIVKGHIYYQNSSVARDGNRTTNGTLVESSGICTSISGLNEGLYTFNVDNSVAGGGTSSKLPFVLLSGTRDSGDANEQGFIPGIATHTATFITVRTYDNDSNDEENLEKIAALIFY